MKTTCATFSPASYTAKLNKPPPSKYPLITTSKHPRRATSARPQPRAKEQNIQTQKIEVNLPRCTYLLRHEALAHPPHHRFYRLPRRVGLGQRHQQRSDPRVPPPPYPYPYPLPLLTPALIPSLITPSVSLVGSKSVGVSIAAVVVRVLRGRRDQRAVRCPAAPRPSFRVKSGQHNTTKTSDASEKPALLPRGSRDLALESEVLHGER